MPGPMPERGGLHPAGPGPAVQGPETPPEQQQPELGISVLGWVSRVGSVPPRGLSFPCPHRRF